ncbi:unnamed protein product [Phytomonas sp. EM1]|nr:unnamed protein product [Phytomonas sp. EM1]|eukprot:CCW62260.1 unnamed protein product [Phytomonas sp. isolate EM1]
MSNKEEYLTIEENAWRGLEYQNYPTDFFATIIIERPFLLFLTILIPLAVFVIPLSIGYIYIDYTVGEFQLRPDIEVRASADTFSETLDAYVSRISGAFYLRDLIDIQKPRSQIRGSLWMCSMVDVSRLQYYCKENRLSCNDLDNILHPDNLQYITSLERNIAALESFTEVCFTNNLEYGQNSDAFPVCVPPTGLLQYVLPEWNSTEERWHMNGRGSQLQVNYLPVLFMNPNYAWFFDSNFSTTNHRAHLIRTEFTLASSVNQSVHEYKQKVRTFIRDALWYLKRNANHPFIWTLIGGDIVESLKTEENTLGEYIRLLLVSLFCLLLVWWHSGSILVGMYSILQVAVTHAAACGIYVLIYHKLSIVSFSASVWVMTFCLHGTLSFFDTFVYSGIMPTKIQRNDLSLEQRITFTIRRITLCVWASNSIAIILFLINLKSVSDSLRHFSVFMIIALLWNLHFITFITPAFITLYHYHISSRDRALQMQVDLLNEKTQSCKRAAHMSGILKAIQPMTMTGNGKRSLDKDRILVDTTTSNTNNDNTTNKRHHQIRFHAKSRDTWRIFIDKVISIKEDLFSILLKPYCKTSQTFVGKKCDASKPRASEEAFPMEDYASACRSVEFHTGPQAQYYNRRMPLYADVVHVPRQYTERSQECWRVISTVITQHGSVEEPRVAPLPHCGHNMSSDVRASIRSWRAVAEALDVKTRGPSKLADLLPLVARSVVRAQDTRYIVFNSGEDASSNVERESTVNCDLDNRKDQSCFCTRWFHSLKRSGANSDETNENNENSSRTLFKERRRRHFNSNMMHKRRFTLFERFIVKVYVPILHYIRWFALLAFISLLVFVCVFGLRIDVAGLPTTLLKNPHGPSESFAKLDDAFGHRGVCTFCGPYYMPLGFYKTATKRDIELCKTKYIHPQINAHVDRCDVCDGQDECMDCAGNPNGIRVLQCGGCELPFLPSCITSVARNGTYCEWSQGKKNFFGYNCSVECNAEKCGPNGICDMHTGACICHEGFAGDRCNECAEWLLPIKLNPQCTLECNLTMNTDECACNLSIGRCTNCSKGQRGFACNYSKSNCGPHRVYDPVNDTCVCENGWSGAMCDVAAKCSMRGVWLEAEESPTMTATCMCIGHWRGRTCQLCDCLNGGMCDVKTGKCICEGAFVGERCQTCSAECIQHGVCPTVDRSGLNIRACVYEKCPQEYQLLETSCSMCAYKPEHSEKCAGYKSADTCSMHSECWWDWNMCISAYSYNRLLNESDCKCHNSLLWSGKNCEKCLAPPGATCVGNEYIRGCNGQLYWLPTHTVSVDQCGVCGGDGKCRGCDGIPNSGAVYDKCGVCSGNNDCDTEQDIRPFFVNYLIDFTRVSNITALNMSKYVLPFCAAAREQFMRTKIPPCFMEDYLRGAADRDTVKSLSDLYTYAVANGRMAEVIFETNSNSEPTALTHMIYRFSLPSVRTAYASNESISYVNLANPESVFRFYNALQKNIVHVFQPLLSEVNSSILVTSLPFQSAVSFVYSRSGLLVTVCIGVMVCFLALLIFSASMMIALGGAMVVTMVGFGTLTICYFCGWRLDTVMCMCVSSTIPVSMEYVVNIAGEYTDYLKSTTSHLFARGVSRRTALRVSMLQSLPSFYTSLFSVLVTSFVFSTSNLIPSEHSGQVCAVMHVVLLFAVTLFSGTLLAVGPRKSFHHWTVSIALTLLILPLGATFVSLCIYFRSYF